MASRALVTTEPVDVRKAFQQSLRRALQMVGALMLFAAMLFLALALVSYTQTDPSPSTAAAPDGPIGNWMGRPGAWAAERAMFLFGCVASGDYACREEEERNPRLRKCYRWTFQER